MRAAPSNGTVIAVRAREPDRSGYAVRSGVRLYYEVFGTGPITVLLLPTWAIVDSKVWKLQVPYLARHFRVITFDPRGNGQSDRPSQAGDYDDVESVADALAVMDETGTESAVGVGLSMGAGILLRLAAEHPSRVRAAVFVGPTLPWDGVADRSFEQPRAAYSGWGKYNAHYWRADYPGFAEFFIGQMFPEAHSSKQVEDGISWALQTDGETLIATERASYLDGPPGFVPSLARRVSCPSLVVHGSDDHVSGVSTGVALAEALGCRLEIFDGGGHCVQARHPVRFNVVLRSFLESVR
jgi:pimeloyl-ACP methyl ester carboxylesterase